MCTKQRNPSKNALIVIYTVHGGHRRTVVSEMTSHCTGTVENSEEGNCTPIGLQVRFDVEFLDADAGC